VTKREFQEPLCEVVKMEVEDIVTMSWGGGMMPLDEGEGEENW